MEEIFLINQLMTTKQYDEVGKVTAGYCDDYLIRFLLHHAHFKDHYRLIAVDLSK